MQTKEKLKLIAYKDLKTLLPAGNHLEKRYEKSKDKSRFDEYLYTVYEGDISTDVFYPSADAYEYYCEHANEDYGDLICTLPIVLGNVRCKTANIRGHEGSLLITGNLNAKNIYISYAQSRDTIMQVMGNLTVDEVCYTQGKGLWGQKFYFNVNGDVNIHTWINQEQAAFKSKSLTVKKEFLFPQPAKGERPDWSQHSLEEFTTYFNKEVLDIKEYGGNYVDFFFNIGSKLDKGDYDYLAKEGAQNEGEKTSVEAKKETAKKTSKEKEEKSEEDKRQQKIFDDKTAHLKPGEKLNNDELTDVYLSLIEKPKKDKKQPLFKIFENLKGLKKNVKIETDKPQSIETIVLEGISFKVITREQATLIDILTDYKDNPVYGMEYSWSYPDSGVKPVFLLAEEDVEIEKLELHYNTSEYPDIHILGYIFQKKITAFQYIQAYHHKETSPALIVLGNATAPVFILSGNTHYIGGNLTCGSLAARNKNGALYVKGDTIARLIHSKGMPMYFARFHAVDAICCTPYVKLQTMLLDENDNIISVENDFPNTHFLSDIVHQDYIKTKRNGKEKLLDDYYETPVPALLDLQGKADRYNYTHFRGQFTAMAKALATIPTVKSKNQKVAFSDDAISTFIISTSTGETVLCLSMRDEQYNIRRSGVLNPDTNTITLFLEYLDENDNPKYQWEGDENTEGLEFSSVKHAMYRAFSM